MRNFIGAAMTLALLLAIDVPAQAQGLPPGWSQKYRHDPSSSAYVDLRPNGYARRHGAVRIGGGVSIGYPGYGFGYGYGVPISPYYYGSPYYGGYGYSSLYGGYNYGYGYGFSSFRSYMLPPVFVPTEQYFGLAPIQRMLGVNNSPPPALVDPNLAANFNAPAPLAAIAEEQPAIDLPRQPRVANAQARERAETFLEYGDERFAKQEYRQAYERYKLAAESAPDSVEAYLREGQTMIALGNYEFAARFFKCAFGMHPQWATANFNLEQMYANNGIAKRAHVEALAKAAEDDPNNIDLLTLLVAQLYYDGQPERSLTFFRRAKELSEQQNEAAPVDVAPLEQPAAAKASAKEPANENVQAF